MRNYLKRHLETLKKRYAAMEAKLDGAETKEEIRSIGDALKELRDDINDVEKQLAKLDKDEDNDEGDGNGQGNDGGQPANEPRSVNPMKEFREKGKYAQNAQQPEQDGDKTNSAEYRSAFMAYVMRGTPIPAEVRDNTLTTDVVSVIPTVVVNKIIERMEEVGTILNLVTRTSYAAGVEIPTSATKPVATWVSEGQGSEKQKKTTGKISFTYFKLRCEVSVSMEVHTMALSAFEAKLAENVANAMVKAIEAAIIMGDGNGKPTGILYHEPAEDQVIPVPADGPDYATLCKAEAAVPAEFETSARWCMNKKTFMAFVGMVDSNGQPIARVNHGISGKPERTLLGREVVITQNMTNEMPVPAFIFNFSDYILNTIYDMGIQRKQDWDNEDLLTKAVMSVDGKCTDTASLVILTMEP